MRVLLMAEECNPELSGLPTVGFQMVKALSRVADVTLVTLVRNRAGLKGLLPDVAVEYVDTEYIAAPLLKLDRWLRGAESNSAPAAIAAAYPTTIAFDYEVQKAFKERIEGGSFEVVHRLTPVSPELPSPMATWCPAPYVLGPLNGGLTWPAELGAQRVHVERGGLRGAYRWLPYHGSTYRNASAILASYDHTLASLPPSAHERCVNFPELGVASEHFPYPGQRPVRPQLEVLAAGRFLPHELLDLVVSVFAGSAKLRTQKLVIAGSGPERPALERLVQHSGLEQVVEFAGELPSGQLLDRLRQADVFFYPSSHDLDGGVVLQAMACGCVPLVLQHGGPGGLVHEYDCGVAVPLGSPSELILRFTEALERYVDDRARRLDHAEAAYERAIDHFSWDAKARKLHEVYEWVTGRRNSRPIFGDRALSTPWPVSSIEDVAAYGT